MKNVAEGHYNFKDSITLDDIAYRLYINSENEKRNNDNNWVYYNQESFIGSVDCEQYYEKANIILRNKKLNKIKDGI